MTLIYVSHYGAKTYAHWAVCTWCDHIVLIEISLIMETGRKLRVKLYVMTRGQRLPTSNGFIASHTYCSFYNIFQPLPQCSTMEKALWMARRQRAKRLHGISVSHLSLQITAQCYRRTNWNPTTAHLYCTRDRIRKIWERKQKNK